MYRVKLAGSSSSGLFASHSESWTSLLVSGSVENKSSGPSWGQRSGEGLNPYSDGGVCSEYPGAGVVLRILVRSIVVLSLRFITDGVKVVNHYPQFPSPRHGMAIQQ